MSFWSTAVERKWIEGDPGYYERMEAKPEEFAHAVRTAYAAAKTPEERKEIIDALWAEYPEQFQGDKAYWYEDRTSEIDSLDNAARAIPTGGPPGQPGAGTLPPGTPSDATYTGDEDISHVGLPGRPEIWKNTDTGEFFVVYFVPGVEPEVPMIWSVDKEEDLQSFFGEDEIHIDRQGTQEQFDNSGAIDFGGADEIVLKGENPYAGWESQFEREKQSLPFLNDPEVAALFASAWMEGRQPTEAELASMDWFREKTGAEQQWWILRASQPETAKQLMESNKLAIRREMESAGILEPPQAAIDYMATQWTTGLWTDEMKMNQVALLADPLKSGNRDAGLYEAIGGTKVDSTQQNEKFVKDEVLKWLGPVYGEWSDAQIEEWASRLRNDPDAKDALATELSRQRMAVLPEYTNESLTYEDIATPWRNMAFNTWGQSIDEKSATFQNILKANDAGQAGMMLREEGLTRGVKQVEDTFVNDLQRSFGGSGGVRGYAS
jgi:hypothetical protein